MSDATELEAELAQLLKRPREAEHLTLAELERRVLIGEPFAVMLWGTVPATCIPDKDLADRMAVLIVTRRPIKPPRHAVPFAQGKTDGQYWYHFSIPDADLRLA